ncbi:hypothetical protein E4U47_007985 [Claviceps purpurea]|nr:hypothetical protein E4U47_007985 [Claviceps purpurea]
MPSSVSLTRNADVLLKKPNLIKLSKTHANYLKMKSFVIVLAALASIALAAPGGKRATCPPPVVRKSKQRERSRSPCEGIADENMHAGLQSRGGMCCKN